MMVFTMPCLKKSLFQLLCKALFKRLLPLLAYGLLALSAWAQNNTVDISQLKIARLDKDLVVSAQVNFELPSSIEDAMLKGVSLTFLSELEITRERWYWRNKTVLTTIRQIRISYQALTRRWRVLPWSELTNQGGLGVQLPQTYETLSEALAVAQRIHNWRLVDFAEVSDGQHWMALRYRLDMSQLPKPLQIGLLGQEDWRIAALIKQRIVATDTRADIKP
jgi:Domain of unknown function (DUF4390)